MSVVDGTFNATFMLWNETAKSMIGKSVTEVWDIFFNEFPDIDKSDKEVVSEFSKFKVPSPVENLIGKEYLFKVLITERHIKQEEKVYVVDRFSNDQEMIQKYKKSNHEAIANSGSPSKDQIGDTVSVQEENDSQSLADFKTPQFPKSGKRNLDPELQEAKESSSTNCPNLLDQFQNFF